MQTLTQNMRNSPDNPQDVKVTRWTDGDYEWVQGEIVFKDLNDLNQRMARINNFESFSLTRQPGILRDQFTLNARLKPLMPDTMTTSSPLLSNMDPSTFIGFHMAVQLPGHVTQTNGTFDAQNTSVMLWTVNGNQAVNMQATSETWDWLNISAAGVRLALAVLAIGGDSDPGVCPSAEPENTSARSPNSHRASTGPAAIATRHRGTCWLDSRGALNRAGGPVESRCFGHAAG